MSNYTTQPSCRICKGELHSVLNLGLIYPSAFLGDEDIVPQKAPLDLVKCQSCGLVQLGHTVDLDSMYRQYYYQSSINPTMIKALADVVNAVTDLVTLEPDDVVVDIGANDGTSLSMYPDYVTKVAFEPSLNLAPTLQSFAHYTVSDYFSARTYPLSKRAKVVTSLAMFYDLPDPAQFVKDVTDILAPDGLWVMQISDLKSMLETNLIENVCHEHLEYYCTLDILNLMRNAGLEVFRIEHNEVNGGSLRYYINWIGQRPIEPSVAQIIASELDYFTSYEGSIEAFAERVDWARRVLVLWLKQQKVQGKRVYGLAASTKANTLLQYFGIDHTLITAIGDLNPDKFGKRMIGSDIPIISEAEVFAAKPDGIIVFAWHFKEFFLKLLKPYMDQGGAVVLPLPQPEIYPTWADDGG